MNRQLLPALRTERATALMLVPTLMLVLLTLGSIAVDLSLMHLAQRSIHRIVTSAADDAAGMIDGRQVQLDGRVRVDERLAARTVVAHMRSAEIPGRVVDGPEVTVAPDGEGVEVSVTVEVDHVLMRSLSGGRRSERISVAVAARILP